MKKQLNELIRKPKKKNIQSSSFLVSKVWNQLNQTELNWFNQNKTLL